VIDGREQPQFPTSSKHVIIGAKEMINTDLHMSCVAVQISGVAPGVDDSKAST
jgi:hypothetical protein